MYIIKDEKFEGPLDLLLDLIEKQKLSISEISLSKVTDDYVVQVRKLESVDPEQLAEFLVVAAQLMLIKSRSLLPHLQLTDEETGSIEDLESRLVEYRKIKELAKALKSIEIKHHFLYSRESFFGISPIFYPPPKLTIERLKGVFEAVILAIPKIEKLAQEKIKRIMSLEEKIKHIRSFLQASFEQLFSEMVKGTKEKVEVIVSFLAILELTKQQFLDLKQDNLFDDIIIRKL